MASRILKSEQAQTSKQPDFVSIVGLDFSELVENFGSEMGGVQGTIVPNEIYAPALSSLESNLKFYSVTPVNSSQAAIEDFDFVFIQTTVEWLFGIGRFVTRIYALIQSRATGKFIFSDVNSWPNGNYWAICGELSNLKN